MNIRIVHLLSNITEEREQRSIKSINDFAKEYKFDYIQLINKPYQDELPIDTCNRPNNIGDSPGNMILTKAHYGCYKAHKDAILNSFADDFDALLIFECDAIINTSNKIFAYSIFQSINYMDIHTDICMWTFGPNYGHIIEDIDTFYKVSKFFECHAYMITDKNKKYIQNILNTSKWDAIDLLYATNISDKYIGIYKSHPLVLQAKGYSLIDKKFSLKNALNMDKI